MASLQGQSLVLINQPALNSFPDLLLGTEVGTFVAQLLEMPSGYLELVRNPAKFDVRTCPLVIKLLITLCECIQLVSVYSELFLVYNLAF